MLNNSTEAEPPYEMTSNFSLPRAPLSPSPQVRLYTPDDGPDSTEAERPNELTSKYVQICKFTSNTSKQHLTPSNYVTLGDDNK